MKIRRGMFGHTAAPVDLRGITETIQRALAGAALDTRAGPLKQVSDTIEQALSAAGLIQRRDVTEQRRDVTEQRRDVTEQRRDVTEQHRNAIDSTAREIPSTDDRAVGLAPIGPNDVTVQPVSDGPSPRPGEFLERSFCGAAGSRTYKTYIPIGYSTASGPPVPLVVMLHGCTQNPDDFAAGTRMNLLADEYGFIVVYPAQSAQANMQKCWNWFRTEDQGRESGEPAIIAGITREVASRYRIDNRRTFVAGLSAGAGMAIILGATYPDLYAAVGAHSGLAYGAAHDMPSAFGAMQGAAAPARGGSHTVPTIVFHGDADHTVAVRNATTIVEHATAGRDAGALRGEVRTGSSAGGRAYSRTDYTDGSNQVLVEHWTLHGAGHAWSGGSAAGSFTDPRGPDASREMIRFFFGLPRVGTA